jgi:hypothetical protein
MRRGVRLRGPCRATPFPQVGIKGVVTLHAGFGRTIKDRLKPRSTARGCLIFEFQLKFIRNGRNLTEEEFLDAFVSEVARRISIEIKPMVERRSSKAEQTVRGETEGQTGIRRLALGVHEAADLLRCELIYVEAQY